MFYRITIIPEQLQLEKEPVGCGQQDLRINNGFSLIPQERRSILKDCKYSYCFASKIMYFWYHRIGFIRVSLKSRFNCGSVDSSYGGCTQTHCEVTVLK